MLDEITFPHIEDKDLTGQYPANYAAVVDIAANPFVLMKDDLLTHNQRVRALLKTDNKYLDDVVAYLFEETVGGKKVRPVITTILGAAINVHETFVTGRGVGKIQSLDRPIRVKKTQQRLGEITEMVHVASLLHDDVLDMADTRRGAESINERFGNKMAVMTGDFLLSRASLYLARLGNPDIVSLYAQLIHDLVRGEVMQMRGLHSHKQQTPFQVYIEKTYCKTGSLIANSCKATALLGSDDAEVGYYDQALLIPIASSCLYRHQ